jgi:hypothetical protein
MRKFVRAAGFTGLRLLLQRRDLGVLGHHDNSNNWYIDDQRFTITSNSSTYDGRDFTIFHDASGKCVDVNGLTQSPGAVVQIRDRRVCELLRELAQSRRHSGRDLGADAA